MRLATAAGSALVASAATFAFSATSVGAVLERHAAPAAHAKRNPTGNFNDLYLASNYQNLSAAPNASPSDAPGQTVITSGGNPGDGAGQVDHCNTIFINTAEVEGSADDGWRSIPNVNGFYIDRNTTNRGNTLPVYMEAGKPFDQIKRIIVAAPGKPRDSWKYTSLFRNSLICAVANTSTPVQWNDVMIVGPMWLTQNDRTVGAGEPTDIYFSEGGWAYASKARGPGNADDSAFDLVDKLVSRFANQSEFPALTSITFGGHSLGASFTQRYAMLRRDDASTDALVRFWVGNPGAYVWPSEERPVQPRRDSCASEVNEWAYGIEGGLPAYAYHVADNASAIYQRYFSRTIQYALGLDDDGPGDTHCEAQYQGDSHLSRGQNMQRVLEALPGGMPPTQAFNYVPDTSHQDYRMIADPNSQEFLFVTDLNRERPAGTETSGARRGGGSSSDGSGSSGAAGLTVSATLASLALVAGGVALAL